MWILLSLMTVAYVLHMCYLFVQINRLRARQTTHDAWLDYVLRRFSLHVFDPYVVRPHYEEKRCFHCNYPVTAGHADDCAWAFVRPLTRQLYPPKP